MNRALFLHAFDTQGASYAPESEAFFERLATEPTDERKAAYDVLILALVEAGVWAKLDVLYIFAAADEATALTNLISSSFDGTIVGTPTFQADVGYNGTGANRVDSYNPSTASGHFAQNDAMICGYSETPRFDSGGGGGFQGELFTNGGFNISLYPKFSDTHLYVTFLNAAEQTISGGGADGMGLFLLNRSASTGFSVLRNNTTLGSPTATSTALANSAIRTCISARVTSMLAIGGALSAGERTALYNAVEAYRETLGLNRVIYANGDSLSFPVGDPIAYLNRYGSTASPKARIINDSVAGSALTQWNEAANLVTASKTVAVDKTGKKFIYSLLAGANDLAGYVGGGVTFAADVGAFFLAKKAAGYDVTVLCTALPQTGAGYTIQRNIYNGIVTAPGWAAANGVDIIVDFAADSVMGPDAAAAITALYSDGVHPTAQGHINLMAIYKAVVDAL